jgi:hypothetical protein
MFNSYCLNDINQYNVLNIYNRKIICVYLMYVQYCVRLIEIDEGKEIHSDKLR